MTAEGRIHQDAPEAYYMGCWRQSGHYLWKPGMERLAFGAAVTPWGHVGLDVHAFDGQDWVTMRRDGWTAVGREDRTQDTRPGSHSVFAFHADLTREEAIALARQVFPEIFERTGW